MGAIMDDVNSWKYKAGSRTQETDGDYDAGDNDRQTMVCAESELSTTLWPLLVLVLLLLLSPLLYDLSEWVLRGLGS